MSTIGLISCLFRGSFLRIYLCSNAATSSSNLLASFTDSAAMVASSFCCRCRFLAAALGVLFLLLLLLFLFLLFLLFVVDIETESFSVSKLTGDWVAFGASACSGRVAAVLFPLLFGTSIKMIGEVLLPVLIFLFLFFVILLVVSIPVTGSLFFTFKSAIFCESFVT